MTTYRLTVRNGKIDSKELGSSPPAIFGMLYGDRSIGAIAKALDEGSWVSLRLRGHPLLHEAVSQAYYAGARCVLELAWADPRYRPLFESPDYLDHYGLTVIGRMAKRAPPEAYRASPSDVAQVWIGAYQAAEAKASAVTGAAGATAWPGLARALYGISLTLLALAAWSGESVWFGLLVLWLLSRSS